MNPLLNCLHEKIWSSSFLWMECLHWDENLFLQKERRSIKVSISNKFHTPEVHSLVLLQEFYHRRQVEGTDNIQLSTSPSCIWQLGSSPKPSNLEHTYHTMNFRVYLYLIVWIIILSIFKGAPILIRNDFKKRMIIVSFSWWTQYSILKFVP